MPCSARSSADAGAPALIEALRAAFAAHADAAHAGAMQAYMKSALPFYGIPAPLRRRLTAAVVKAHPLPDTAALARAMLSLWRGARFREERYAALDIARMDRHHPKLLRSLALLPVLQEMIVGGAWWDPVDDISGDALGQLLEYFPQEVKPVLRRWTQGDDLWLRRAAMLCQRKLRAPHFDAVLLYEPSCPRSAPAVSPISSSSAKASAGPCANARMLRPTKWRLFAASTPRNSRP